jgi:formylglycine-generating enzyme required for sulfatase activity/tRNA A-37 threonylcarbamoyl transferase component Bud32
MEPRQIDRYQILSEIARGGMATVYLAHDSQFNRQVAIKILAPQFTHDPTFLARFRREAEAVASLEHQSIVPVYDYGDQEDEPYLVMRHMAGGSLTSRIEQGPVPLDDVIAILKPIAAALDYAHQKGFVHRDVKPSNILFDASGSAYLSDFGIVKLAEATASYTGSSVIGTPAYMSPEQVQGSSEIDGRSDVYSLGCVVYEMLSGEVPYKAETTTQQLMKHVLEPVPRITRVQPDVPPAIEAAVMRAMAKLPGARYPTAEALIAALEEAVWSSAPAFAPQNVAAASAGYGAAGVPGAPFVAGAATPAGADPAPGTSTVTDGAEEPGVYATMLPPAGSMPTEYQSIGYEPLAQPQQRKRRPAVLIAILAVVLFGVLGGGGFLAWQNGWLAGPRPAETPAPPAAPTVTTVLSGAQALTPTPTALPTPTFTPTPEAEVRVTDQAIIPELPTPTLVSPTAEVETSWVRPADGMTMVKVQGRSFEMGSSDREVDAAFELCQADYDACDLARFEVEKPAHLVEVSSFWLDRTEVTNAQYAAFLNERGNKTEGGVTWLGLDEDCAASIERAGDGYRPKAGFADHPVVCVSWYGALAYAEWVGGRLPTEAEWEYAARGAPGAVFPWGETFDGTRLNFCDINCAYDHRHTGYDDGYKGTAPVGSYPSGASWSDVLDLSGNVWEWTQTRYKEYPYDPSGEQKDPRGPGDRVLRGGSFSNIASNVRGAYRVGFPPETRIDRIGFRVVVPVGERRE